MLFLVLCIYSLFPFNTTHCGLNKIPQTASYLEDESSEDYQQNKRYKINHIQTTPIQNPLLKVRLLSREESEFNSCIMTIFNNNMPLLRNKLDNLNINKAYTVFIPYAHHSLRQLYENKQYSLLEFAIAHHTPACVAHNASGKPTAQCFLSIIAQQRRDQKTTCDELIRLGRKYKKEAQIRIITEHLYDLCKHKRLSC